MLTPTPAKILVLSDSFHELPEAVEVLASSGHEIGYIHALRRLESLTPDELPFLLHETEALVTGRVMTLSREALELLPRLKVVALHTSGSDNVDLDAATERGICVTNVKGSNAAQCADLAIGLILATVRQIVRGDKAIRAGRWASDTNVSFDVSGATLGVVGLGQIGKMVVKRAHGFDMNLLVHTRTPDQAFAERYGVTFVTLDELLSRADIVSLNASLGTGSYRMIGERELRLMKPTAFLTNIARGELVDEAALYRALTEGWIAGAGLDVFETEPIYESHLFNLENVVLTPHQAGLTASGKLGAAVRAAHNALLILAGEISGDIVNPEAFGRTLV